MEKISTTRSRAFGVLSTTNQPGLAARAMLCLLAIYRYFLSPLMGDNCRFYPSCSNYAHTAFIQYGFIRGTILSFKRLLRCHPFAEGGIDPVPETLNQHTNQHKHRCNHNHGSDPL